MGSPRQEYWNRLPFSSPRDLSDPEWNLHLLLWQADSLPLSHHGSSQIRIKQFKNVEWQENSSKAPKLKAYINIMQLHWKKRKDA